MKGELPVALFTVCRNWLPLGGAVPSQAPEAKASHLETRRCGYHRRAQCHSRAPVLVQETLTGPVLSQISPRPLALSESLLHCTCVSQEVRITLGLWSRIHVVTLPSTPGAPEKQGGVSQLHIASHRPPQAWHKAGPAGVCEIDENPVPSAGGLWLYTDRVCDGFPKGVNSPVNSY